MVRPELLINPPRFAGASSRKGYERNCMAGRWYGGLRDYHRDDGVRDDGADTVKSAIKSMVGQIINPRPIPALAVVHAPAPAPAPKPKPARQRAPRITAAAVKQPTNAALYGPKIAALREQGLTVYEASKRLGISRSVGANAYAQWDKNGGRAHSKKMVWRRKNDTQRICALEKIRDHGAPGTWSTVLLALRQTGDGQTLREAIDAALLAHKGKS